MTDLRRSSIGIFDDSLALESSEPTLEQCVKNMISPLKGVANLQTKTLNSEEIAGLRNGVPLTLNSASMDQEIAAIDAKSRLLAILRAKKHKLFAPSLNFVPYWNSCDGI